MFYLGRATWTEFDGVLGLGRASPLGTSSLEVDPTLTFMGYSALGGDSSILRAS